MAGPANRPQAVAEERVEEAVAAIESARRQLELAQQRLTCVNGVLSEWKRLGRLHELVKLAGYDLVARREQIRRKGGLSLDGLI